MRCARGVIRAHVCRPFSQRDGRKNELKETIPIIRQHVPSRVSNLLRCKIPSCCEQKNLELFHLEFPFESAVGYLRNRSFYSNVPLPFNAGDIDHLGAPGTTDAKDGGVLRRSQRRGGAVRDLAS